MRTESEYYTLLYCTEDGGEVVRSPVGSASEVTEIQ